MIDLAPRLRGWQARTLAAGALLVVGLGCTAPARAQPTVDPPPPSSGPGRADDGDIGESPVEAPTDMTTPADPARGKLDAASRRLADIARTEGDERALAAAPTSGLAVASQRVRVIVESVAPEPAAARSAILAEDGIVEAEYADAIQALIAPSRLAAVAASPEVRAVRVPSMGIPGRAR